MRVRTARLRALFSVIVASSRPAERGPTLRGPAVQEQADRASPRRSPFALRAGGVGAGARVRRGGRRGAKYTHGWPGYEYARAIGSRRARERGPAPGPAAWGGREGADRSGADRAPERAAGGPSRGSGAVRLPADRSVPAGVRQADIAPAGRVLLRHHLRRPGHGAVDRAVVLSPPAIPPRRQGADALLLEPYGDRGHGLRGPGHGG